MKVWRVVFIRPGFGRAGGYWLVTRNNLPMAVYFDLYTAMNAIMLTIKGYRQ